MQPNIEQVSREAILETTLKLINENDGITNVTLRGIAKRLGCTHTNLYNYFDSLDEIFWESIGQALLEMMNFSGGHLSIETDFEEGLYLLLSKLIDFSMEHPGWFRLIWLESVGGKPSAELAEILSTPSKGFNEVIMKASGNKLSEEKVIVTGDILHGYLHGELCKWINSRGLAGSKEETKTKIMSNLKYLYKLMIQ